MNDIYALSLPGVKPSASITWFQAQAAGKNARQRLPSNAEWRVGGRLFARPFACCRGVGRGGSGARFPRLSCAQPLGA